MSFRIIKHSDAGHGHSDEVEIIIGVSSADFSEFSQRSHDLRGAMLRLDTALKMLGQGFDFNSPDGKRYLVQLLQAHEIMVNEFGLLDAIFQTK
jgi:hypothetical protein